MTNAPTKIFEEHTPKEVVERLKNKQPTVIDYEQGRGERVEIRNLNLLQVYMNIPEEYRIAKFADMKDIQAKINLAKEAIEKNQSVILTGECGTRKTWLAVCLMRLWYVRNKKKCKDQLPQFISVPDLNGKARDIKNTNMEQLIYRTVKPPMIVLDDIGADRITDITVEILYRVLEKRKNRGLPVIVTTNMAIKDISRQIDDRVASRLNGMGIVIRLEGIDLRLGEKDWRDR